MAHYLIMNDALITMHRGDHFRMPIFITKPERFAPDIVPQQPVEDTGWNVTVESEGFMSSIVPFAKREEGYPFPEKSTYRMRPGEKLYVGIMEPNKHFECSIVKKIYTADDTNALGGITFELFSKDTEYLLPGKYFIEAKLLDVDGEVQTVLPKKSFRILD